MMRIEALGIRLLLSLLPMNAGFAMAGSESEQFLSGTFVNSPVIEFPDNGFGAILRGSPVPDAFGTLSVIIEVR